MRDNQRSESAPFIPEMAEVLLSFSNVTAIVLGKMFRTMDFPLCWLCAINEHGGRGSCEEGYRIDR